MTGADIHQSEKSINSKDFKVPIVIIAKVAIKGAYPKTMPSKILSSRKAESPFLRSPSPSVRPIIRLHPINRKAR